MRNHNCEIVVILERHIKAITGRDRGKIFQKILNTVKNNSAPGKKNGFLMKTCSLSLTSKYSIGYIYVSTAL